MPRTWTCRTAIASVCVLAGIGAALFAQTAPAPTSSQDAAKLVATGPKLAIPDVSKWPTMAFSDFMAGHSDEKKRQEMWKLFQPAERLAKIFAGEPEKWKPLKTITLGTT